MSSPLTIKFENHLPEGEGLQTEKFVPVIDEDEELLGPVSEHKQDWTTTTPEQDSWAAKERRRSTVWAKIDDTPLSPKSIMHKKTGSMNKDRRGSVLSLWSGGKDKDGRDILTHHDNESAESDENDGGALQKTTSKESTGSERRTDRRGSILSMWVPGKDALGRDVMTHNDEEWLAKQRIAESTRRPSDEARSYPTTSYLRI